MNKKSLISFLEFLLIGCAVAPSNTLPSKGTVNQEGLEVFPISSDNAYVGDPMPYFDNGKMNVFYLQDGRNTIQGYHPINLMQTENYYEYEEKGTVIPYTNSIFEQDYSLGTGSVIKDKEGLYHFYYTGHNGSKSSGLEYFEKIQHATSTDLINWTKHPEDGFYGGHNDFRDPYVLYMEEDCYWMLITTRHLNSGVLKLYKSTDLKHWNYDSVFYDNGSETYNMECPTLIKYNNYWYLTFSEQGGHRVMHYRYTDSLSKPWIVPENDYLDDIGFYAGRLEKDDKGKMYAFGWCATKVGEIDQGDFDWGGNLVVHEIVQKTNGELGTKLVDSIKEKISNEVGYELISNKQQVEKIELSTSGFNSKVLEVLSDNITRIEFTLRRTSDTGKCGISFGASQDNTIGTVAYEFNIENKYLNYFNNIYGISDFQYPQLSMKMENAFAYNVQIIIDDQIVSVYVDDILSLTTRIYDLRNGNISFFVNNSSVVFENISFYE